MHRHVAMPPTARPRPEGGLRLDDVEVQLCGLGGIAGGVSRGQRGSIAATGQTPPTDPAGPLLLVLPANRHLRERTNPHIPSAPPPATVSRRRRLATIRALTPRQPLLNHEHHTRRQAQGG